MTTESFLFLCRKTKLSHEDMENMTIGMCIDYIQEYIDQLNPKKKPKVRKANQKDFDNF